VPSSRLPRNVLAVTAEGLTIDVPGGRLHGSRWPGNPDGPPLVLLHSGVADRRGWVAAADGLTGYGEVIAYDRRGFGESAPTDGGFRHLDDLWAVLAATTDRPAWLIGNSIGGGLALDAALEHPERVAGLVLIAPGISGAPDEGELDADTIRLEAAMKAAGDPDILNRYEMWLWLDGPAGPEGRVSGPARDLALAMNAVVLANDVDDATGATGIDAWARLGEVRVPTTVAWGALDVPLLITECRTAAARIPGARTVVLPGAAHFPHLERPQCLAELVGSALA
jgi:pimeloyl-ACP methyl ester carboxylesterase